MFAHLTYMRKCANSVFGLQESHVIEKALDLAAPVKGITKLFGGVGKRRESLKP